MKSCKKYDDLDKHVCFLNVDNPAFVQYSEMLDTLEKQSKRIAELERVNAPNLLQMAKGIQSSIDFYRKNSDNKVKGHIEYGILGKRPVDNPDAIPISILERDIYALRKQAKGSK